MKERVWGKGNKVTTVVGSVLGAAIMGAAQYYASTGNVSSWQPYAMAGGGAAVAAIGAMMKGKTPPAS